MAGVEHPNRLRLSEDEAMDWVAYHEQYGLGNQKVIFMLAQVCSLLAANGGQRVPPQEFIPGWEPEPQTIDEIALNLPDQQGMKEWLQQVQG